MSSGERTSGLSPFLINFYLLIRFAGLACGKVIETILAGVMQVLTHQGTKKIFSERLVLRKFHPNDNASMRKNWISNPNIQKMYSEPTYTTVTEVAEVIAKFEEGYRRGNYYRWAISLKGEEDCIGQIAYFLIDEKNHWAEIEYCIGEAFQNKGYMTEAVKAIIEFGFDEISLHKVQVCHKSNNIPSRRVIEKSGFVYEGALRDYFFMDGEYVDRVYYSMLETER